MKLYWEDGQDAINARIREMFAQSQIKEVQSLKLQNEYLRRVLSGEIQPIESTPMHFEQQAHAAKASP